MIGDLARNLLSEIPWVGNDEPKYNFQHSEVALIFRQGELTLVQYGKVRLNFTLILVKQKIN